MSDSVPRAASARLLPYSTEAAVAFPDHRAIALVGRPAVFQVPGAPSHGVGLIEWHDALVPLIDLEVLLDGKPPSNGSPSHALLLTWQAPGNTGLQFGAVCAPRLVASIRVSDAQGCALPEGQPRLAKIASGCFEHDGRPVGIVDTWRLFGSSLAEILQSS